MRRNIILILLCFLTLFFINGCSFDLQGSTGKDTYVPEIIIGENGNWFIDGVDTGVYAKGDKGEDGATGVEGEKGEIGPVGPQGEPGKDGRSIVSITLTAINDNVDTYTILYSDNTTSIFTVTNGKDGSQGNKGIQGEKGEDGNSIYTGNGVPNSLFGKSGDSYIDLDTWDYYVNDDCNWVLKGNIKGENAIEHNGTEGLEFYPINDTECAVTVGRAVYLNKIVIPSKYKQYTVTTIFEESFSDCENLEIIIIPNTVTTISRTAFVRCSNLKSVVIPASVEHIGSSAFAYCGSVTFYCESSSMPSGWNKNWNNSDRVVYWSGEWEYDENGNPVPIK